jgi:hypothetical protein
MAGMTDEIRFALAGIVGAVVRMPPALGISAICGGLGVAISLGA